jgi:hypothetical protein
MRNLCDIIELHGIYRHTLSVISEYVQSVVCTIIADYIGIDTRTFPLSTTSSPPAFFPSLPGPSGSLFLREHSDGTI